MGGLRRCIPVPASLLTSPPPAPPPSLPELRGPANGDWDGDPPPLSSLPSPDTFSHTSGPRRCATSLVIAFGQHNKPYVVSILISFFNFIASETLSKLHHLINKASKQASKFKSIRHDGQTAVYEFSYCLTERKWRHGRADTNNYRSCHTTPSMHTHHPFR